jgi:hypothetical protein
MSSHLKTRRARSLRGFELLLGGTTKPHNDLGNLRVNSPRDSLNLPSKDHP